MDLFLASPLSVRARHMCCPDLAQPVSIVLGAALWVLCCGFQGEAAVEVSPDQSSSRPPNVLMICIDDLNDWVGCLGGHPDVQTPHIDRLASQGRNFANAHCVVPVCSASRISVMSGLHATTHGSYDLGPSYTSIPRLDAGTCLQAYFKQHGYTTLAGGKVLHHGFNGPLADAIDVSFPQVAGTRPGKRLNWPGGAWDWGPWPATDAETPDYQLAHQAAQALAQDYEQPFFMSVGIFRPHVPMFAPPKWFALYDRAQIALPLAPPSDLDDIPPNFQGRLNVEPTQAEVLQKGDWRGMVHAYLACVSFADRCVGEILEGLANGPHRDNTVVLLWSDHGFHLGEKQHWAKRTLWEESTRVPLIFAGPGIAPGPKCHEAVSLLDIYPTLLDLCGLPQSQQLDGVSLTAQLNDPHAPRKEPAISSSYYGNHAIRTKQWRYIRYADGAEELYHHPTDPDEFHNLATSSQHAEAKATLARWLPTHAAAEVKPPRAARAKKIKR
jgi:choline-sulfatase